ncbi:hypothetical protein, partial [Pseudomonas phage vB_Pae_CF136a]
RSLNPGQPFRIRSTRRGIPETVVRVWGGDCFDTCQKREE